MENYNMNSFAVAINQLSEELRPKLPPTDCRLRPDLRLMENGDFENAEKEKDRLEMNQSNRRKAAIQILKEKG